jgi:hypothetical protein
MGMANFSGGQAIGSGFRVIFRNPVAIGVWALVYLILAIGPTLLIQVGVWGHTSSYSATDPAAALAMLSRMAVWIPVILVISLCHAAVVNSAVYRAVLDPEDRQYFYLRLSRRELSVGLTMLPLLLIFVAGIIIAAIALALIGRSAPGLVTFLATIGAMVGLVWAALRFSMATPMAFAEQRFVFTESWALTAGHGWKLFGVAFCLVVILIGLEMAIFIPTIVVLSLSGALSGLMSTAQTGHGFNYPPALIAAYVVILPIFAALTYAIIGAPWANIYQQLTGETSEGGV